MNKHCFGAYIGGVSEAGDFLLDTVRTHYKTLFTLSERKARIVLARLGKGASIHGTAQR